MIHIISTLLVDSLWQNGTDQSEEVCTTLIVFLSNLPTEEATSEDSMIYTDVIV